MENTIPSAKSGSDWSTEELLTYNITIQTQSVVDFFGHELCPIEDPDLLSPYNPLTSIPTGIHKQTCRFLNYLYLISNPDSGDAALNDFAISVLEVTDFHRQIHTLLLTLFYLPLTCEDNDREAIQDICLISNQLMPMILLVCQRDKPAFGSSGAEPPVIAGAIAAFQYNNRNRAEMGLPTLDTMTIPCITVKGTRPLFYKVPVTRHLSDCVATGKIPMKETVVARCGPPAPPKPLRRHGVPGLSAYRPSLLLYIP